MTHEESEDISFWVSQLEGLVKGFVRKDDLDNLKIYLEKSMEGLVKVMDLANLQIQMEENGIAIEQRMGAMEDNIERIVKLL